MAFLWHFIVDIGSQVNVLPFPVGEEDTRIHLLKSSQGSLWGKEVNVNLWVRSLGHSTCYHCFYLCKALCNCDCPPPLMSQRGFSRWRDATHAGKCCETHSPAIYPQWKCQRTVWVPLCSHFKVFIYWSCPSRWQIKSFSHSSPDFRDITSLLLGVVRKLQEHSGSCSMNALS